MRNDKRGSGGASRNRSDSNKYHPYKNDRSNNKRENNNERKREEKQREKRINLKEIDEYPDIRREYARWELVKEMEVYLKDEDFKKDYESKNILERWLMSSSNLGDLKEDSVIPSNIKTLITTQKMKEEFKEKGIEDGEKKTDYLSDLAEKFLIKNFDKEEIHKIKITETKLVYRRFTIDLSSERFDLLCEKGTDLQVATTLLRYHSISPGAQHWNVPSIAFKKVDEEFGLDIEGFASPLNSQLLKLKKGNFCSLFKDTDYIFGSLGSFFEQDFVGKHAMINTPYLPTILEDIVDKCISDCKKADEKNEETILIVGLPCWEDAIFYKKILSDEHMKKYSKHDKGTYFFENSNLFDKQVTAKFPSAWIVLVSSLKKDYDFSILDRMFT